MELGEIQLMHRLEDQHWWFAGKRMAIQSILAAAHLPPGARVMDLGCGTGANLEMLSSRFQAVGVEFDQNCLGFACQMNGPRLVRAISHQIPLASASLDMALVSDVLYHQKVQVWPTLRELKRVLKPGGWLLILDSAYQGLMGPHDVAMHGARRFTRQGLSLRLEMMGFTIQRATYRNSILAPVMITSRLLQRWLHSSHVDDEGVCRSDVNQPNPLLNRLLTSLMRLEARWLKSHDFALGGTVCILARK